MRHHIRARLLVAALVAPPLGLAAAGPPSPAALFTNVAGRRIPSVHESAVQARRILQLRSIGTLSTVFPPADADDDVADDVAADASDVSALERRPRDVGRAPIGLMEYYAACGPEPYNPTILAVTVATGMKNAAAGSNATLSARYVLPADAPRPPPDPWAYLPANLPRFALVGYLERLDDSVVAAHSLEQCFFARHPEARIWAPGTDVHDSWWGRLVVREVYFFGGFGDRARIAWLPRDEWQGVTQEEVDAYRLVGEQGFKAKGYGEGGSEEGYKAWESYVGEPVYEAADL